MNALTPVEQCGDWYAKRDDVAAWAGPGYPAGAKVRQFARMAAAAPGAPLVVGCSADSAMQVYVAACARQLGRHAAVFVPGRAVRTAATAYAASMGATVHEVRPGYLAQCRARAREYAAAIGGAVRWDMARAVLDSAQQVANLPAGVQRIVVPLGSGATTAGILVGLADAARMVPVLGIAVSSMASVASVCAMAARHTLAPLPPLAVVQHPLAYGEPVFATLPGSGMVPVQLDPYYAAKALAYVCAGDCFWIPGVRPQAAFPQPVTVTTTTNHRST